MEVLADCIQATLNEMQKAVKKLKNAVSNVDDSPRRKEGDIWEKPKRY